MDQIEIDYLSIDEIKVKSKRLLQSEYFDLEINETASIDSVPKFIQPYEYVTKDPSNLVFLMISVKMGSESRQIKQTFWNEGQNILTERIDEGVENYREMILSTCKFDNNKNRVDEIIRVVFASNTMYPVYHSYISRDATGVEKESKVETSFFIKLFKKKISINSLGIEANT